MADTRRIISKTSINRIANKLKTELFGNSRWKFDYNSMRKLLNRISSDQRAPNPHNIPYGMAIHGMNKIKNMMDDIGTGGTYNQRQAKQALSCGVMDMDNDALKNKDLLVHILPHTDDHCRNDWIDNCVSYLDAYRTGESDAIFNKYQDLHRNS